ncbi:hypothetical protein K8I28_17365 [bacterium]|nr:hypothetical protein [bacterium]
MKYSLATHLQQLLIHLKQYKLDNFKSKNQHLRKIMTLNLSVKSIALILIFLIAGCAGPGRKTKPPALEEQQEKEIQETVSVQVERENLRQNPNGDKVGEVELGQTFVMVQRRGNWTQIQHPTHGEVWIWSPSLGNERVNPMSPSLILGKAKEYRNIDSVVSVLGHPTNVEEMAPGLYIYHYNNQWTSGSTRFGTDRFTQLKVWVDATTKRTFRYEIELPPYNGDAAGLLSQLGLRDVKASGNDFERSRYERKFPGIERLDLLRPNGDFRKFSSVVADKLIPDRWQRMVIVTDQKAKQYEDRMEIVVTLQNNDSKIAYVAPVIDVTLVEGRAKVGSWRLGPVPGRLSAGNSAEFVFPVPFDPTALDFSKLGVNVVMSNMIAVPPVEKLLEKP